MRPKTSLFLFNFLLAYASEALLNFDDYFKADVTGTTYVYVGENLTLNCTIKEDARQTYNANELYFHLQKGGIMKPIDQHYVHVTSPASAILLLPNVTTDDEGPYFCGAKNVTLGFSEDVAIEYAPQNITDFHCVAYDWDTELTCRWKHPVEYVKKTNIDVKTYYFSAPTNHLKALCPNQTEVACILGERYFVASTYKMEVSVRNTHTNNTAAKIFNVNTFTAVQPSPVVNLTAVSSFKPGCLDIKWSHERIHRSKMYRVTYYYKQSNVSEVLIDNLKETSYTACGFDPCTNHNFSVKCYPSSPYSGNWSDPKFTNASTLMTAPDLGPRVVNGSFTTSSCISGRRNVTLFWQDQLYILACDSSGSAKTVVEESIRNRMIDGFHIKGGITKKVVSHDNYSAVIDVPCSLVSVSIFAYNEGGQSLTPSILLIPDSTVSVPEKIKNSFAVGIHSSKSLKAEWTVVNGETEHQNYTVFWCQGTSDQLCLGPINWTSVMGSERYVNIPIPFDDRLKFIYGISITNTNTGMASQIFWTLCLFEVGFVPDVQYLKTKAGQNKIYVSWKSNECNYLTQKKVDIYLLKYCLEDDCNNTIKKVEIPGNESDYIINNLEGHSNYRVTLQPQSGRTKGKEVEPWQIATPIASETSKTTYIAAVVGTLCGIGLLILLFYMGKKCKDGYDKMNRKCNAAPEIVWSDIGREIPTREATSDRTFHTGVSRPSEEDVQIQDNGHPVSTQSSIVADSFSDNTSREKLLKSEGSTQQCKTRLFQIQEAIPKTAFNGSPKVCYTDVESMEKSVVDAERQNFSSFVGSSDLRNSDQESLPPYLRMGMRSPPDQSEIQISAFQSNAVVQYVSQDTFAQVPTDRMNILKHSDYVSHPGTHYSQLAPIKNSDYGSNGHEGNFEDTALIEAVNSRGTDFSVVTTTPNSLSLHENSSVTLNDGAEDNSPTGISTLKYSDYVSHYPDMHYSQLAAIKNPDYGSNNHEGILEDMALIEAANRGTDFSVVTSNSSSVLDQPNSLLHHENSSVTLNDGAEDNSPASGQTDYIFCNGVPAFNTPANFQSDAGDDGYKPSNFIC